MKNYNADELSQLPSRYRALLLNCFTAPKPCFLIGTKSKEGLDNLAIFSQVFHVSANPFLVGVLFRPDVVERHTLKNISDTSVFTLNAVKDSFKEKAHQTSAKYPVEQSEFDAVGLSAYQHQDFWAPAVAESPLQIGLSFVERVTMQSSETILIIGKVAWVRFEGEVTPDGFWDAHAVGLVANGGLDSYYDLSNSIRFPYAEPK